jgi:hypothetical protein
MVMMQKPWGDAFLDPKITTLKDEQLRRCQLEPAMSNVLMGF